MNTLFVIECFFKVIRMNFVDKLDVIFYNNFTFLGGIIMNFKTMKDLKIWLRKFDICRFAGGSQGDCYRIGDKVYKIFLQYVDIDLWYKEFETYDKDSVLQFSHIANNTYIWPNDVITVGNTVVGYITDYVSADSLYKYNPLKVNLDHFEKSLNIAYDDIKIISLHGVKTFDVMYNILYGKSGVKVIDTMEYSKNDIDPVKLYNINKDTFNYEIRLFLIDGYFDEFVNNNQLLHDMCYDSEANLVMFLKEFRKQLSEYEGYEISKLWEAKNCIKKKRTSKYIREFV